MQRHRRQLPGAARPLHLAPRQERSRLIIRAVHPRKISGGAKRWEELDKAPVTATFELTVRNKEGNAVTHRMNVRSGVFEVQPPEYKASQGLEPVRLGAILVSEEGKEKGTPGLRWQLLTSLELEDAAAAVEVVRLYGLRWNIGRFHYVVKSGFGLEELQLRSVVGLRRAMLIYSISAIRLMVLQDAARGTPGAAVSDYLSAEEVMCLQWLDPDRGRGKAGREIRTVGAAVWVLGRLGGFLGRAGDGQPGLKNLWRGLRKLGVLVTALRADADFGGPMSCG